MLVVLPINLPLVFLICFSVTAFFLVLYYAAIFARFAFHKPKKIKDYRQDPISIVITSCDQAHHLSRTLPALLTQQYNDYEVIVVSDNSHDETAQVVEDYQKQYPHLVFVDLNSSVTTIKGKKFPLAIGIKEAKHKLILLTDANCMPASPYWLQNMAKHFVNGKQIVLGYCSYEKQNGLFNRLLRFDSLQTAIQYFSYSLAKMTYMGKGQNLAYTKELFMKQRGFASHNHIEYGDDDIFIGRAATDKNVDIEYFSESFTVARPKVNFRRWFKEKKGYVITRAFYKPGVRFLLGAYSLLNVLFWVFLGLGIGFTVHVMPFLIAVLSVFVFKTLCQYLVFGFSAAKLKEKDIIPHILFIDILYTLISILLYIVAKFSRHS